MKKIFVLLFSVGNINAFCQQSQLNIYFDYNKYDLTQKATAQLDSLLSITNPLLNIQLSGYCDSIGNLDYNDQLSLQRIDAIKKYLLRKGVAEKNFDKTSGFGKRKPLNDNATEDKRLLNRRVEILFTKEKIKEAEPLIVKEKPVVSKLETQIKDTAIKAGESIVLNNMNFVGGRHILVPESNAALQELLMVMQKYPTLKIEIQGHICCVFDGTDGVDFETGIKNLSIARAKAIYEYLISKGITAERLSYQGFGSRHPIFFPERNADEQAANRRVEIKIISK
ncbi:MAG: OmpA family protein [Ferruginibacter sp.]